MANIDPQSQTFILSAIDSLRNEMLARQDATNEKLDSVVNHLATLNGKTQKNTIAIGRIQWLLGGTWSVVLIGIAWALERFFG